MPCPNSLTCDLYIITYQYFLHFRRKKKNQIVFTPSPYVSRPPPPRAGAARAPAPPGPALYRLKNIVSVKR